MAWGERFLKLLLLETPLELLLEALLGMPREAVLLPSEALLGVPREALPRETFEVLLEVMLDRWLWYLTLTHCCPSASGQTWCSD